MFSRLHDSNGPLVHFEFEGKTLTGREGESVAAALLASQETILRESPASGESRGPYCLMGACYECLVVIDGEGSRQACMTPLKANMKINRQKGPRGVYR